MTDKWKDQRRRSALGVYEAQDELRLPKKEAVRMEPHGLTLPSGRFKPPASSQVMSPSGEWVPEQQAVDGAAIEEAAALPGVQLLAAALPGIAAAELGRMGQMRSAMGAGQRLSAPAARNGLPPNVKQGGWGFDAPDLPPPQPKTQVVPSEAPTALWKTRPGGGVQPLEIAQENSLMKGYGQEYLGRVPNPIHGPYVNLPPEVPRSLGRTLARNTRLGGEGLPTRSTQMPGANFDSPFVQEALTEPSLFSPSHEYPNAQQVYVPRIADRAQAWPHKYVQPPATQEFVVTENMKPSFMQGDPIVDGRGVLPNQERLVQQHLQQSGRLTPDGRVIPLDPQTGRPVILLESTNVERVPGIAPVSAENILRTQGRLDAQGRVIPLKLGE